MKKRLTGKPACIAILAVLIIISLVEIILRGVLLKEAMFGLANAGEPIITALFALMLILFALKGKDRLFYILCGAFLGYFVLKQLFGLPEMIANLVNSLPVHPGNYGYPISIVLHLLSMVGIIAIGALIVEYMNDGTIYNKAFNILCIFTILMFTSTISTSVYAYGAIVKFGLSIPDIVANLVLIILNTLSRMVMVFLFTFFAYDSAKKQLAKTNLTK